MSQPPESHARKPPISRTARNTFVYRHLALRAATDAPFALEIGDGELFQVVIRDTDPSLFRYSINAIQVDQSPPASSSGVDAAGILAMPTGQASLTMRHDQHFAKYRVTIAALHGSPRAAQEPGPEPDVPPLVLGQPGRPPGGETAARGDILERLYPVSFDLWIMTRPQWKVSFSGGVAFSNLADRKFFIKTDDAAHKTVEEDLNTKDRLRHDVVALANVYFDHQYFRSLMFGAAFGLGDNGGSTPHYFIGPSVVLGRNFTFTAGLAAGRTATLPAGQALHEAPINGDNTLTALGSRYRTGFFVSVAFSFVDKESAFKGAFSSTTETTPAAAPAAALTLDDIAGDYTTGELKETVAVTRKDGGKAAITVTLDETNASKNGGSRTLQLDTQVSATDFKSLDEKNEVTFTRAKTGITMEWLQQGTSVLKATRSSPKGPAPKD